MHTPSPAMRALARRLISASRAGSDPSGHNAALVIEQLRIALSTFAGGIGFATLLRRALILGSADIPFLQRLQVGADGRLEGFARLAAEEGTAVAAEAEVAVAAHLLELLVTFIGEPLTLRLVQVDVA